MELRHLRYFQAVAQERSFTQAARKLHISQSGVSGQIRDLEDELDVMLLRRTQRSVSLTPEGSAFLHEVCDILQRVDAAAEMVGRAAAGRCGRLKIGLCGPATAPFLPKWIRQFRTQQPGVSISLKDLDPAAQPQALVDGIIDVGFTRGIPASLRGTLDSELLFEEPLLAVLPQGHRLEAAPSVALKDLAHDRMILYARESAPELFDGIVSLCKRARFSPELVDTPALWQSVLTMVEAGEGVSIAPATVKHLRAPNVVFKPLQDRGCTAEVVLAWRADAPDPVRERFLDLLRKRKTEMKQLLPFALVGGESGAKRRLKRRK